MLREIFGQDSRLGFRVVLLQIFLCLTFWLMWKSYMNPNTSWPLSTVLYYTAFPFNLDPKTFTHLLKILDICLSPFRWSMLLSRTTGCLRLWTARVPCTSSCSIAGRRTAIIVPNSARLLTTWTRWSVTPTCWRPWHLFLQGKKRQWSSAYKTRMYNEPAQRYSS